MTEAADTSWSPKRRRIISVLLLLHLWAILSAPLSFPPPVSGLSKSVSVPFKWYLKAAYLNHGYRFFNGVGATSIVRYELVMADGTVKRERFADRDREWPRLYYHRHLMVGETIYRAVDVVPPLEFEKSILEMKAPIPELRRQGYDQLADRLQDAVERNEQEYLAAIKRRNALVSAVAEYLMAKHDAVGIRIYIQAHKLLSPEDVETGSELGSDEMYKDKEVMVYQTGRGQ